MHVSQKIFGPNYFLWSALKVPPSYFIQNMSQALSKYLKQWINWIISKMHPSIWKILFVLGANEYLERLEGKIRQFLFWIGIGIERPWTIHSFSDNFSLFKLKSIKYRKVTSRSISWLVAHPKIFWLFMKGKFNAYVLWPLDKMVQNWIIDRSTAWNFTVGWI